MKNLISAFSPIRNLRYLLFRPGTNYAVVDGLRALSMVMILMFHSYAIYVMSAKDITLPQLIEEGGYAWSWIINSDKSVDVFFVISGFLITNILLRQIDSLGHIRLSNFYMRRFFRLTPVYYFSILLYTLIPGTSTENLAFNFVYLQNFLPYEEQAMNWTWTLAIEEQFYLLYPLILMFMLKTGNPIRWFILLLLGSCAIRFGIIMSDEWIRTAPQSLLAESKEFHAHHFSVLYDNLYTRFGALLSGCFAAYLHHYYREGCTRFFESSAGKGTEVFSVLAVLVLMVVPLISTRFDDYQALNIASQTFGRLIFSGCIAIWILVSLEQSAMARVLNIVFGNRFWYPIAQLSYSMYLVHVIAVSVAVSIVVNLMQKKPEIHNYSHMEAIWIIFGIGLLLTILVSVIIYLVIERPLMNLRK